ncbi:hypothetical protein Mapa_007453 [Marchantia paleacea]|nr:hypothetical protein Mapa_007453 [Marchantia paleacea]
MVNAKSDGPMPNTASGGAHLLGSTVISRRFAFMTPKMAPIYPLFGIMTIAFGLAGVTIGRQLTVSPDVLVDKHKRKNVPDIEQPELMLQQSEQFMTNSPLRKLAKEHKKGMFFSDIVEQPNTPTFPRESNHYISENSVIAASL